MARDERISAGVERDRSLEVGADRLAKQRLIVGAVGVGQHRFSPCSPRGDGNRRAGVAARLWGVAARLRVAMRGAPPLNRKIFANRRCRLGEEKIPPAWGASVEGVQSPVGAVGFGEVGFMVWFANFRCFWNGGAVN